MTSWIEKLLFGLRKAVEKEKGNWIHYSCFVFGFTISFSIHCVPKRRQSQRLDTETSLINSVRKSILDLVMAHCT